MTVLHSKHESSGRAPSFSMQWRHRPGLLSAAASAWLSVALSDTRLTPTKVERTAPPAASSLAAALMGEPLGLGRSLLTGRLAEVLAAVPLASRSSEGDFNSLSRFSIWLSNSAMAAAFMSLGLRRLSESVYAENRCRHARCTARALRDEPQTTVTGGGTSSRPSRRSASDGGGTTPMPCSTRNCSRRSPISLGVNPTDFQS
mmetsp:Transcript_21227/g.54422  ORF Transcript_21227/g.54422 Transcript_21227/m.54422 type:complete len:202 (+) Transcript_21227:966-1571(+)